MLVPVPYGSTCCTCHHVQYSSPNRSNKTKRQEPLKRACLPENRGLGKKGKEDGPKAETDKTETVTGLGSRTREEM